MVSIHDDVCVRRPVWLTLGLLAANALAFALELSLADGSSPGPSPLDRLLETWGLVPRELVRSLSHPGAAGAPAVWLTPLSSMFLHAGLAHLAGNLCFLWIFGGQLEARLGSGRFGALYLFGGLSAAALHVVSAPDSHVPTVGSSGAISGLLGAYAVLLARARVERVVVVPLRSRRVRVHAVLLLALWFALQLGAGVGERPGAGGGARWAHLGGFLAGAVWALPARRRLRPGRPSRDPGPGV